MKKSLVKKSIFLICFVAALLIFTAGWAGSQDRLQFSVTELEALGPKSISSSYFDTAMDYRGSTFTAISFADLLRKYKPGAGVDAVLLNCRDDYQGILSIEDIEKYDLRLATEIQIRPEYKKPDWLNPLLILVPDGAQAPRQERFMTANISEIIFVKLKDYYAPLAKVTRKHPDTSEGLRVFQDNCLFCHSLKGIGGNKGIVLLESYNFSKKKDVNQFLADFKAFHNKDNVDKQNVDQFVSESELIDIAEFLLKAGDN